MRNHIPLLLLASLAQSAAVQASTPPPSCSGAVAGEWRNGFDNTPAQGPIADRFDPAQAETLRWLERAGPDLPPREALRRLPKQVSMSGLPGGVRLQWSLGAPANKRAVDVAMHFLGDCLEEIAIFDGLGHFVHRENQIPDTMD